MAPCLPVPNMPSGTLSRSSFYFPSALACDSLVIVERSLFREKINSDYNNFVARVALEVVDSLS